MKAIEAKERASYEKPMVSDYGDLQQVTAGFKHGGSADVTCYVHQVCTFVSGP